MRTEHPPILTSSQLLESYILARAALLARKGRLKQIEALLLPPANESQSRTDTLDLLAKVYAQQGKIGEARDLWLRALQQEPSNAHFLRAISYCENLQRLGTRRFFLSRLTGLKVLVIAQKVRPVILRLSKEVYLGIREVGISFVEFYEILIGKKHLSS